MINVFGTVYQSVKMAELENKWKQKKKNINNTGLTQSQQTMLERYKEDLKNIEKSNQMSGISSKIATGKSLTFEEIEYLKENNPQLLKEYEQTKREREAFERDLKKCRTKEEVERLKLTTVGSFFAALKKVSCNSNISKSGKLCIFEKILSKVNNFKEAYFEFTKTQKFKDLPTDDEKRAIEKAILEGDTKKALEIEYEKDMNPDGLVKDNNKTDNDNSEENTFSEFAEPLKFENPFNNYENPDACLAEFEDTLSYIIDYLKEERITGSGMDYFDIDKKKKICYKH